MFKNPLCSFLKQFISLSTQAKIVNLQNSLFELKLDFWKRLFIEAGLQIQDEEDIYIIRETDKYIDEITVFNKTLRRLIVSFKDNKATLRIRVAELVDNGLIPSLISFCSDLLTDLNSKVVKGYFITLVDEESQDLEESIYTAISFYYCISLDSIKIQSFFKALNHFMNVESYTVFPIIKQFNEKLLDRQSLMKEFDLEEEIQDN